MAKVTVRQEFLPKSWAEEFLNAHDDFVRKVRRGEIESPTIKLDYGMDGANPYGVGSSSLAGDARQWWYRRKGVPNHPTPAEYHFTAEQGRMMEVPVLRALEHMGLKFETQTEARGKNHGGLVDGIAEVDGKKILFESKHIGRNRFIEAFEQPLYTANNGYFWQAQSYLHATGAEYSLFVITSQDSSAVKAELTMRRRKNPDQREPNSKVFAFKLYKIKNVKPIEERAAGMLKTLEGDEPPARERNPYKDWECMSLFCGHREQCLTDGPAGDTIFQLPTVETEVVYL